MRCEVIRLPGGQAAIVCGRGPARQAHCVVCRAEARFQCDAPAPTRKSKTYDAFCAPSIAGGSAAALTIAPITTGSSPCLAYER
jgi:hypothetical protein